MEDAKVLPVADTDNTEPGAVVDFSQRVRMAAYNQLTSHGTRMPEKIGDLMLLLGGMDQAALTTRKLNIEEKAATDGRKTLEAFENLRKMLGGKDMFAIDGGGTLPVVERVDGGPSRANITAQTLLPGEGHQGEHVLSVADYVQSDE